MQVAARDDLEQVRSGFADHREVAELVDDFWIEPEIKLARNYHLSDQDLSRVLQLAVDHEQEIRDAWHRHFGR